MHRYATAALVLILLPLLLVSCRVDRTDADGGAQADDRGGQGGIVMLGREDRQPEDERAARARQDTTWRAYRAEGDTRGERNRRDTLPEIDDAVVDRYAEALAVPLRGDTTRQAIFYAQVLLDRAGFSPGEIDGYWGQNTEKAIYWLQRREGLNASGELDRETLQVLAALADAPDEPQALVRTYTLSQEDVDGPFEPVPEDPYEQEEMDRLGYESLSEKLGEDFHVSPGMLRELNEGRDINALSAGETIQVPDVSTDMRRAGGNIDRLVVSDGGRYLHALDASGEIVYHFPATLGSEYDPSPRETLTIESVHHDPIWHYQPSILADVDDDDEEAMIPPGPNNAVGVVWMALSKEHYGIHGTAAPGSIGHTTSSGCVRLTNWDAQFLADHVREDMIVEFRDVDGRSEGPNAAQAY